MTINTNQSFYDSEVDARSETPTNNNAERTIPIDLGESLTRENINACIEEFSKMWAPIEKSKGNDQINNNSHSDNFVTIQTTRSDSFQWTDFKRNGVVRPMEANMDSLTLEIDPNAWNLPAPSTPPTDRNVKNCAISDANSPLDTPRATSPIGDTHNIDSISIRTDEEDNQSTYDLMHLMLEPHLRPVSPEPNDQVSNEMFEQHKRLAKEYFKVNNNNKFLFGIESIKKFAIFSSDSNRNRLRNQTQRRNACRHGRFQATRTIGFVPKTRRKGTFHSQKIIN